MTRQDVTFALMLLLLVCGEVATIGPIAKSVSWLISVVAVFAWTVTAVPRSGKP